MAQALLEAPRWELYRLFAEPFRLRLLALVAEEELSIGELAELTREAQPNVSRHLKLLRKAGLVAVRKQGTRVLASLAEASRNDPLVQDALRSGRGLCESDGSLGRIAAVVQARDAAGRAFFEHSPATASERQTIAFPAYLTALRALLPHRDLAVDVGTGDGALVALLAPLFDRVLAVDRAQAQLELAAKRSADWGYRNVEWMNADYEDPVVAARVDALGGADAVFASRLLHHAPRPQRAVQALARLAKPGGQIVILDYRSHDDERMREEQADLWLGFAPEELLGWAQGAGLTDPQVFAIPAERYGAGPDAHLSWQVLTARRHRSEETRRS
jgi:DNA-binding transcriptional ArsR family regulator/SAM-dependent methyltransferase